MRYFFISIIFFILPLLSIAQTSKNTNVVNDSLIGEDSEPIQYYDQFNPVFGGDSIRFCNGSPCIGRIKDVYGNGKDKHIGFYENGKLVYYKNFYENGQMERFFKAKGGKKHVFQMYYKSGKLRSDILYVKGAAMIWKDYYPNGNLEMHEEYDKSMEFHLVFNFYYENGKPQTILELKDEELQTYKAAEYYESGQVKEEGEIFHNVIVNDYQREGKWNVYNEAGKLIREEWYVKGRITNEKIY